jgi:lipid-A-disaccharide synthase
MSGLIISASDEISKIVHKKIKTFPTGLSMVRGMHEEAITWADMNVAVSGTITMHIARQRKAMVGIYKTDIASWLLSKVLLRTKFILLPNIIADREIVPEFAPYIGGPSPIVNALSEFLADSKNVANQSEELQRVCYRFANKRPAEEAATLIIRIIKTGHM